MKQWKLVQELFEASVVLEPAQRDRFLDEQTGGDRELTARVMRLLSADDTPLADFSRSATDLLLELRAEPPAEELCGTRFGAYLIEEHVSSGGMGHVYRALRESEGTQRRVALKVLRPGLDTEDFLQRFRSERRTLAALEHENIVSFLDAGSLPDGRPFLVMEYVEGVPVTQWARGVDLANRLTLFLQVLRAVQYAHGQLVVHRDLKPSNVLVSAAGTPKLLDFGVAAMIDTGPETSRPPMTACYAAPEQLRNEHVTTASDVHALGTLLHEVVTGQLPDDGNRGPSGSLDGDLAAIVVRARMERVEERYASVEQLAEDLQRFLNHEPVVAGPSGLTRRGALFLRRHRLGVAIAGVLAVTVVTGWLGSELGRQRARREAGLGWGAHGQAKIAAGVFESWMTSVTSNNPALGANASAYLEQALLEKPAECAEAEVLLRLQLADLYLALGDRTAARRHSEAAWELGQVTRGVSGRDKQRARELIVRAGGVDPVED